MKLFLCAALVLAAPIVRADSVDGVRFDQHKATGGFLLIARGKPGLAADSLRQAYKLRAEALCDGATLAQQPRPGEYPAVDGGRDILQPAGGVLLAMKTPYTIKPAPSLSGMVACPGMVQEAAAPLRLAIASNLGAAISYVDQGFASFNRGQLDVPVSGVSFDQVAVTALVVALRERGYQVDVSSQPQPESVRLLIDKSRNAGESFDGVVMMTKLSMLGIDNASYAFCGFRIAALAGTGGTPQVIGQLNTREKMAPIYSSWKNDMAGGPSEAVNARSYEVLARIVAEDVRAAVHAMPAESLNRLIFNRQEML